MKELHLIEEPVYWLSPLKELDDFGAPYNGEMFDAPTRFNGGQWANMSRKSWEAYGRTSKLGLGLGQRYLKQSDGKWLKVEG